MLVSASLRKGRTKRSMLSRWALLLMRVMHAGSAIVGLGIRMRVVMMGTSCIALDE